MAESTLQQARSAYSEAVQARHETERVRLRIEALETAEQTILSTVHRLRLALEVEAAEAERWEGKGFSQILLALIGRLDDRRADERAEAEKAAVELASAEQRRAETAQQLTEQRARRGEIRALAGQVDERLAAVRAALGAADPTAVDRLVALEQQTAEVERLLTELTESRQAAGRALASIAAATASFESAGNWGVWDMVGGGMISSMVKKERVREGLSGIDRVQSDLRRLEQELDDVRHAVPTSVPEGLEIGSGAWTWDVWFDNIFSDLNMQSRIREMEGNLTHLAGKVRRIANEIDDRIDATRSDATRLRSEVSALLLG
jgi:DNA repair exonuclease SbcCD ATPase subunit